MVQLHQNLDKLEDLNLNVDTYIISKDTVEEQKILYDEIKRVFGKSLPILADPELKVIDQMGMKNGDIAYRGYGMMDSDGNVIFQTKNDHWGEQLNQTLNEIEEEYQNFMSE
ncbi:redoxin domain-containing protein [Virgibacillus sp. MSP4-1]|nr:redoxin domain-containing protein [Virgibacillus sp. MSP4-1]